MTAVASPGQKPFSDQGAADRIAALADQCVQCGLCLPHCPSYRVARTEAESPRGRIALARALATGQLAADASAGQHLDHCLACGSCERVCPSQVQYGALLHVARSLRPPAAPWLRRLQPWLASPRRLRAIVHVARALRMERWLPALLRRVMPNSSLARLANEMPALPPGTALPSLVRATRTPARGRVALLTGCVASAFDRDTHAATARLLAALGYEVAIPPSQGCCGALAYHNGDDASARAMSATTRTTLIDAKVDAVLVSASGCHDTVRDLTLVGSDLAVHDASRFLAEDPRLPTLRFRPLALRAALHTPCTQAGIRGAAAASRALLARIPQLKVLPLPEQPRCCGAAGSYFLDHPQIAAPLRAEKLDQTLASGADLLLTSNIGCRLYLGNGLRQRDSTVPVLHPLALLAQQLESVDGGVPGAP